MVSLSSELAVISKNVIILSILIRFIFPSGVLVAQRFTAQDDTLKAVKLYLSRTTGDYAPGTLNFEIWENTAEILFEDDFESYTAGAQLACQDSIHWNTWSSIPCDWLEDPFVSNSKAHSGSNAVWIQSYNDLIKTFPNYTTGKYSIEFHLYIPSGYTASWSQLAVFINSDSTEWGFIAMFDPFGNGNIAAGEWNAAQFSFSYDTWMHNELIVDLNSDWAEYYFEGNRIHSWQWTVGAGGDTITRQLSATNIMGFDFPNIMTNIINNFYFYFRK